MTPCYDLFRSVITANRMTSTTAASSKAAECERDNMNTLLSQYQPADSIAGIYRMYNKFEFYLVCVC